MKSTKRAVIFQWEDYYYNDTFSVSDKISEKARQNNPIMAQFELLRDYELWRYCQGLEDIDFLQEIGYE